MSMTALLPHLFKTSHDYAYINARIRGAKSLLLNSAHYQDLLSAFNLKAVLEILQNTPIGEHFQMLKTDPSPVSLEEILRRDLCQTTQTIIGMLDGHPLKLFEALLLYWDMETLRTVLRGKYSNRSPQEILDSTLPVGKLNEPLIKELIQAPDIRSIIEILLTWNFELARPLFKILPVFEEKKQWIIMENTLEKGFFDLFYHRIFTLNVTRSVLNTFYHLLLDLFNARSALRLRGENFSPDQVIQYFLGKGLYIGKSTFIQIIQQDSIESACNIISSCFNLDERPKDEINLEKALEKKLFKNALSAFMGNPLGFDILFGFLWLKVTEIRNIRIIIRGKIAQIPSEKIHEELIYV